MLPQLTLVLDRHAAKRLPRCEMRMVIAHGLTSADWDRCMREQGRLCISRTDENVAQPMIDFDLCGVTRCQSLSAWMKTIAEKGSRGTKKHRAAFQCQCDALCLQKPALHRKLITMRGAWCVSSMNFFCLFWVIEAVHVLNSCGSDREAGRNLNASWILPSKAFLVPGAFDGGLQNHMRSEVQSAQFPPFRGQNGSWDKAVATLNEVVLCLDARQSMSVLKSKHTKGAFPWLVTQIQDGL